MDEQQSIHERFVVRDIIPSRIDSVSEGRSIAIIDHEPGSVQGSYRPLFARITMTLDADHPLHVGDELSVSMFVYPPSASVPQRTGE